MLVDVRTLLGPTVLHYECALGSNDHGMSLHDAVQRTQPTLSLEEIRCALRFAQDNVVCSDDDELHDLARKCLFSNEKNTENTTVLDAIWNACALRRELHQSAVVNASTWTEAQAKRICEVRDRAFESCRQACANAEYTWNQRTGTAVLNDTEVSDAVADKLARATNELVQIARDCLADADQPADGASEGPCDAKEAADELKRLAEHIAEAPTRLSERLLTTCKPMSVRVRQSMYASPLARPFECYRIDSGKDHAMCALMEKLLRTQDGDASSASAAC
jgi:hypothetical protein